MTHFFVYKTDTGSNILAGGMVPLEQVAENTRWTTRNVNAEKISNVRVIGRRGKNVTFEQLEDRVVATVDNFRFQCAFHLVLDGAELPEWAM